MFSSLSIIAPVEVVPDREEAAQPALVRKSKRVRGKKAKDATTTELAAQSTTLVVTRSATKAVVKASAAPVSIAIGSPPTVPSMVLAIASQSKSTIPSL